MSYVEGVRVPEYQIAWVLDFQFIRFSRSSSFQVSKLPGLQVSSFSTFLVARFLGLSVPRFSRISMFPRFPRFPRCQVSRFSMLPGFPGLPVTRFFQVGPAWLPGEFHRCSI